MVSPSGTGGPPLMEPSTKARPAAAARAASPSTTEGATALRSASTGVVPVLAAASRIVAAQSSAAAGGQMLTTRSAAATTSANDGSSSSPSARARVRADRPVTVATTRAPLAAHARPSAEPIAPGDTIPITSTRAFKQRASAAREGEGDEQHGDADQHLEDLPGTR